MTASFKYPYDLRHASAGGTRVIGYDQRRGGAPVASRLRRICHILQGRSQIAQSFGEWASLLGRSKALPRGGGMWRQKVCVYGEFLYTCVHSTAQHSTAQSNPTNVLNVRTRPRAFFRRSVRPQLVRQTGIPHTIRAKSSQSNEPKSGPRG